MSGEGNEEQGRQVRTMQDLLRFCIQGTAGEDAPAGGGVELDPERKAWLAEAMKAFSVDIVKEMLEMLANIKKELEQLSRMAGDLNRDDIDTSIESIVSNVDHLLGRIDDLDIAADFEKIGGFDILRPLLQSPYSRLQIKGAELVGELTQNHPHCQSAALKYGVLDILTQILGSDKDAVKVKALFGISCLIRANPEAQEVFVNKLDGFSAMLGAMQTSTIGEVGTKIRTKTAFLLSSIICDRPDFKDILFKMGFIDQIVGLLHQEHDQSHEHLLSTLLNFITDFPPAFEECLRSQLQLKALLHQRLEVVSGKPEFLEEENYCKSILALLEDSSTTPENYVADR